MDSNKKGYIDVHDFKKLINDNGAQIKAFNMERIMRYFASGKNINKGQFLKAIAIPPWKIEIPNEKPSNKSNNAQNSVKKLPKKQTPSKLLFKLVVQIYLALE